MRNIGEHVRSGLEALKAQARLTANPTDDAEWNSLAVLIRASLNKAAQLPSTSKADMLAKALLLASLIQREGEHDQRYRLAQSLIEDAKAHLPQLAPQNGKDEKGSEAPDNGSAPP